MAESREGGADPSHPMIAAAAPSRMMTHFSPALPPAPVSRFEQFVLCSKEGERGSVVLRASGIAWGSDWIGLGEQYAAG